MTITPLRRRAAALVAAVLSTTLVLTACSSDSDDSGNTSAESRSFEADNGTIEIPVDPQRIVALGSAATFLSLGMEPVGMPRASEGELAWLSPEQAQINEAAVDTGDEVDYETVANLEPDLIVVYEPSHVLPGYEEDRLQSVAPTVYITLDTTDWKTQVERLADAVGELDNFNADEAEYETLVAELRDEFADLLDSTGFVVLNAFGGGTGPTGAAEFFWEYADSFCTNYFGDVGLKILPENPVVEEVGDTGLNVSIEQLSDTVADADAIIYPLGADGNVKPEFEATLNSNIWQSLPQVQDGRAVGVQCNSTAHTYATKIPSLESLKEALATLPEAG
ncbi:MAG: ABC transporter substrate-binding protein [Micrococcaceae bacterium]